MATQEVQGESFRVTLEDGTKHEITPKLGDLIRFEREYGFSSSKLGEMARAWQEHAKRVKEAEERGDPPPSSEHLPDMKSEWFIYIGFRALKRKKLINVETFDEFLDIVDDVEMRADDEESDAPGEDEPASEPGDGGSRNAAQALMSAPAPAAS